MIPAAARAVISKSGDFALDTAACEPALARPFASVERHSDPASAEAAWRELEGAGGGYQSRAFVDAWRQAFRGRLAVAVARDEQGEAVALLPLHLRRFGPLRVAGFAGGEWANYHMGLFRPGRLWRRDDVVALLRAAAKLEGVDLFAFSHQPEHWDGLDNPLRLLPHRGSPNSAFASALPPTYAAWLDAHFSHATQKKLRKKLKKLEVFGAVAHVRAATGAEARRCLDAFLAHKAAQARLRGEPDLFARAEGRDLLRRLCDSGAMEMHALTAGERVAATFGALAAGERLSGLVVSYDPEVAAASPGEGLLIEVVKDAIARGFRTFDLGVGQSRYKSEICEVEEKLMDTAFAATSLGVLGAAAFLRGRAAMGEIKRRPRLHRLAVRMRRALAF